MNSPRESLEQQAFADLAASCCAGYDAGKKPATFDMRAQTHSKYRALICQYRYPSPTCRPGPVSGAGSHPSRFFDRQKLAVLARLKRIFVVIDPTNAMSALGSGGNFPKNHPDRGSKKCIRNLQLSLLRRPSDLRDVRVRTPIAHLSVQARVRLQQLCLTATSLRPQPLARQLALFATTLRLTVTNPSRIFGTESDLTARTYASGGPFCLRALILSDADTFQTLRHDRTQGAFMRPVQC